MFAFAGLWDRWVNPDGEEVETCTIITTTPNSHLADIHDRMPVILPSGAYASWLNAAMRESTRINHVQNDDEECAKPVESEAPPQASLFS